MILKPFGCFLDTHGGGIDNITQCLLAPFEVQVLSEQDMANLIALGAFSMHTLEVVNNRYARFKQGK